MRDSLRMRSMALKRPAETSHARGLLGTPSRGHCSSAARNASARASSARSKSPSRRTSVAKTRRDSARYRASKSKLNRSSARARLRQHSARIEEQHQLAVGPYLVAAVEADHHGVAERGAHPGLGVFAEAEFILAGPAVHGLELDPRVVRPGWIAERHEVGAVEERFAVAERQLLAPFRIARRPGIEPVDRQHL